VLEEEALRHVQELHLRVVRVADASPREEFRGAAYVRERVRQQARRLPSPRRSRRLSCERSRSAHTFASESSPRVTKSSPSRRAHSSAIAPISANPSSPPGELSLQSTWPEWAQNAMPRPAAWRSKTAGASSPGAIRRCPGPKLDVGLAVAHESEAREPGKHLLDEHRLHLVGRARASCKAPGRPAPPKARAPCHSRSAAPRRARIGGPASGCLGSSFARTGRTCRGCALSMSGSNNKSLPKNAGDRLARCGRRRSARAPVVRMTSARLQLLPELPGDVLRVVRDP